jgi:hypothetical protein
MFDFMVFGYYASAIARAYFPSHDGFASLMLSLVTFGAGFLMRPLGAVLLGAGCSLAYSLATAVFGGFTPAFDTWLIHATGNRAMPGVWVSCSAGLALAAVALGTRCVDGRSQPSYEEA